MSPRSDQLKINVDGVIFGKEGWSGMGVVVRMRNCNGEVIVAISHYFHSCYSSDLVEC